MKFKRSITIIAFVLFAIATQSTSNYEGVSWDEKRKLWQSEFSFNGKIYKSYFENELDAVKRINQLCKNMGIPSKNYKLSEIPNQQTKQQISQFKGVYWHKQSRKWCAHLTLKGGMQKCGGYFNNELNAAKRVNHLCEELQIPLHNPGIAGMPNQPNKKEKISSKYKGVYWHTKSGTWCGRLNLKGGIQKCGGYFNNELDAAKRVNQLCEELQIPPHNLGIAGMPNQPNKKEKISSKYKGVYWHTKSGKWCAHLNLKGGIQKYGGYFNNELDAAKKVNQLCEELQIPPHNLGIAGMPNQPNGKEKLSQYKGVYWHKQSKKWFVLIFLKGQKRKYGGRFKNELDAARRVNQLCEELGIPPQNIGIGATPTQQAQTKQRTSHYKGVVWKKSSRGSGKWYAQLTLKGKIQKYGGYFKDELDAAKRVNQLCEEMAIPLKNPGISSIPTQQHRTKQQTSKHTGVYWHKQTGKWFAQLRVKDQIQKYGGYFNDELDAAKRVNQLCEELGIPLRNPRITSQPTGQCQRKEKTSKYKGVSWHAKRGKWYAQLTGKGQIQKYGGYFNDELDAARRVNQFCEELGIPLQNLEINAIPSQQYQEQCKTLLDYDAIQAEFEKLIKILDTDNDPATLTIREIMITAIRHGKQTKMSEINLQTKNGESALSIAAKHGFSNIVRFLISKGANKEHFTNEHHTPLSLAVTQNHFKVVEVLFEEWMSPNSHEKPYLHLSPIFNVKSREIAQLLIDNDAVTGGLYNRKHQSPLTVACQNGFLDVVEFFLDDGLDINHLDSDNKTPLFYALENKHHDVVNLLNSKGAQNVSHLE